MGEATPLAHGAEAAEDAAFVSEALFSKRRGLTTDEQQRIGRVLRDSDGFERRELSLPAPILDVYVQSGLVSSKSEARRLIEQGGARRCAILVGELARALQELGRSIAAADLGD